jgi:hypothetical protein
MKAKSTPNWLKATPTPAKECHNLKKSQQQHQPSNKLDATPPQDTLTNLKNDDEPKSDISVG